MNWRKRLQLNKAGFSLIELIVSIVILAIVVLPILTAFVVSARTNAKAMNKYRATNIAENIMEGLERESLENVKNEFSGTSFSLFPVNTSEYCELMYDKDKSTYVKGVSSTQDNHKFYFFIPEIKNDNRSYAALITIDARTDEDGSIYEKYNKDSAVMDMSALDTDYDGVCAKADNITELLNTINSLYKMSTPLTTNDLDKITRTINVVVKYDSISKLTVVKVIYRYSFVDGTGRVVTFPEVGSAYEDAYTVTAYDNSLNKNKNLMNMYLLYKPWYTSTKNFPYSTDKIIIDNPSGIDFKMKIIKQNVDTVNATDLSTLENKYRVTVYVNDSGYLDNTGATKSHVVINTNLGTNLAIAYDEEHPAVNKVQNQVTYVFNKTNANQASVKKILSIDDYKEQVVADRLFDVTVNVYSAGTTISNLSSAVPVLTMTGGMID